MQQLVEAVALAVHPGPVEGIAGLYQLQAVPGRDVGERAALGRDDDRQLFHGQAAGVVANPGLDGAGLQRGEPGAVRSRGISRPSGNRMGLAGDQPCNAGPDGIGVDRLAESERHGLQELGAVSRVTGGGEPVHDRRPPVRLPVGAIPLARQRCCQVSPGCRSSQPRKRRSASRRRFSCHGVSA